MSLNISPDVHLRLISQSIVFVGSYNTGERLFEVNLQDTSLFYSQQKVTLDNGVSGIILFPIDENTVYFYSDEPITQPLSSGFTTAVKVPFKVLQDNDVVTSYDVKHIEASSLLTIGNKTFLGRDGLFKSEWLNKINEIKSLQVIKTISYDLTSATSGLLGYVKFDGKHKFGFRNDEVDALFEIDVTNENIYTIRKMNFDGVKGILTFSFNIGTINNEQYIAINVQNTGGSYNDSIMYSRQEIKTFSDVVTNANGFTMDYQINNIEFDDSIFSVNSDGKDLYINQPLEIVSVVNIRQLLEATYYCNNQSIVNQLIDLPTITYGTILSFVLNVYRVKNSTDKVIQGTFIIDNTQSPDNNIVKASLFVDSTKQYKWVFDNTVFAANVITDDDNMFVTKDEKESWNKKTTWLPPVNNIAQLPTGSTIENGYTCFVINEKEVYFFELGTWKTSRQVVSETQNGVMSKEQYKEVFIESSQFKKIKPTIHINKESTLIETSYQKYTGTNVLDLTKRTNLINSFGSNIINLTFSDKEQTETNNMGVFGTNSVGVGLNIYGLGINNTIVGNNISTDSYSNLSVLGSNITIPNEGFIGFGQWNVGNVDNILEIGNGIPTQKSNILSIHKETKIITASGYSVPGGTNNQILVADGSVKDIGALQQVFAKFESGTGNYYGIYDIIENGTAGLPEDIDYYKDDSIIFSNHQLVELESYGKGSFSGGMTLGEGDYSTAFGYKNKVSSYGAMTIGYHNDPIFNYATTGSTPQPTAPLLIIGNGTEIQKSNAFVAFANGDTHQKGSSKYEAGKGLILKTADGTKSALVTLVDDGATLRLNIQEI